jgi:Cys-rich protein (TIGR01571 family)
MTEAAGADWQHGLFGCFDNCTLCLITYIAPCYTAGKNAEAVGESCIVYGILSILPVANIICPTQIRGKIREVKGIQGSFGMDCVLHWFCPFCALIQEAQEMMNTQVSQGQAITRY